MTGRWVVVPAVAAALVLGLTGCGRAGASSGVGGMVAPAASAPASVAPAASTPAPVASSAAGAPESSTLSGIASDLGAAGTANSQADSNASAGDQAAQTSDDG